MNLREPLERTARVKWATYNFWRVELQRARSLRVLVFLALMGFGLLILTVARC